MKKCNLCHELYSDNLIKCPHCEIMLERCVRSPQEEMAIRQRYKKSKSIKNYDTYKQSTDSKKTIGILLMCGSIILDLIATVVLCFDEWNVGPRKKMCKQYLTNLDKAKITGISLT